MIAGVDEYHIFDGGEVAFASKAHDKAFLYFVPLWYFVRNFNDFPKA